MANKTGRDWYLEQLKDPRWQKKRLKILERDNFECCNCSSNTKTLHVHHLKYSKTPWDIEDKYLQTLCESCHKTADSDLEQCIDMIRSFFIENSYTTLEIWGALIFLRKLGPIKYLPRFSALLQVNDEMTPERELKLSKKFYKKNKGK